MYNEGFPTESNETHSHTADHGDRVYDVYKVIAESAQLPVRPFEVKATVEAIRGNSYWSDSEGRMFELGAFLDAYEGSGRDWERMRVSRPEFSKHIDQVRTADYSHPIIRTSDGELFDGLHRIVHAYFDGVAEIPARTFDALPESAIVGGHD